MSGAAIEDAIGRLDGVISGLATCTLSRQDAAALLIAIRSNMLAGFVVTDDEAAKFWDEMDEYEEGDHDADEIL